MMRQVYFTLIVCLVLAACDNRPKGDIDFPAPIPINGAVMIANEGNFQFGNSSLTVLNFADGNLYDNVFENKNNRKLGDVFQSITMANGNAYFVVNNSQKIEVVNPSTYKSVATITGFTSPRYMVAINANKAYVSEYYANAIRVVDLNSNTIIGSIPLYGWMDEMVLINDKVYVTNVKRNYLYTINAITDSLVDSIRISYGAMSIQADANQKLWVLSDGDKANTGFGPALQRINLVTDTVEKTYYLTMAETMVSRLRTNKAKDKMYWLSKHVYQIGITDETVLSSPLIRAFNQNFYGLGIDPRTNELYVSDAKDFVQQSVINRYKSDGTMLGEFKAGLITSYFYFYYP